MIATLLRFLRGYRVCRRMLAETDPVLRQDFRHLSECLVEREPFLLERAAGKRVLHFGFLDSIFLERKIQDGTLLHTQLGGVAASLYGVDIDQPLLDRYRSLTDDHHNVTWNLAEGDIPEQLRFGFDLILFPEVLEHVSNPGLVLERLAELCRLNRAQLCLTVPNAYDMYAFMAAMHGFEVIHPDHCYTFTPHTLAQLLMRSGLRLQNLTFYNFGSELAPGLTKSGMIALCEAVDN